MTQYICRECARTHVEEEFESQDTQFTCVDCGSDLAEMATPSL